MSLARPLMLVALLPAGCDFPQPGSLNNLFGPNDVCVYPLPPEMRDGRPLVCVIQAEPTCELGKAPVVKVTITNRTDEEVRLVGSLDASDCKWRYPHCYFEVTRPDGQPIGGIGRCGNMNILREKDFVKVPKGGSFDPYQKIDGYGFFSAYQLREGNFNVPGEYRIKFVYSTESKKIEEWLGDGRWLEPEKIDPKVKAMWESVPKVKLVSNEVKVIVVKPDEK